MPQRPSLQPRPSQRRVPANDQETEKQTRETIISPPPPSATKGYRSPARVGKKQVAAFVDPGTATILNIHRMTRGVDLQDVVSEALQDYCEKHKLIWYG